MSEFGSLSRLRGDSLLDLQGFRVVAASRASVLTAETHKVLGFESFGRIAATRAYVAFDGGSVLPGAKQAAEAV